MSKLFCNICNTCIACNVCIGVCHFVHRSPSLVSFRHSNDERNLTDVTGSSIGHISSSCSVIIVTRENTTGVWLKEPTAVKREKDTKHAVLRHVKGRL